MQELNDFHKLRQSLKGTQGNNAEMEEKMNKCLQQTEEWEMTQMCWKVK